MTNKQEHNTHNIKSTKSLKVLSKPKAILFVGAIVLSVVGVLMLMRHDSKISDGSVRVSAEDLLAGEDWKHFAGAKQDLSGVHFAPLSRQIVALGGAGYQPNPPVNVLGPHLEVNGDYEITASVNRSAESSVSLSYYFGMPIVYDEWRYEVPSIRTTLSANSLVLDIWNGSSSKPIFTKLYSGTFGNRAKLTVAHIGSKISVSIDSTRVAEEDDMGLFASGKIWFGGESSSGDGWQLSTLSARSLGQGSLTAWSRPAFRVTSNKSNSLQSIALKSNKGMMVGAAVALEPLMTDDVYRQIVGSQFGMITPENAMKPQFIHPLKGSYAFEESDALVEFAVANSIKIHGHTLVFSEANPAWMTSSDIADRQAIMTDHISTVVGHYKDKVSEWDVVNEPLAEETIPNDALRKNIWYQAMGTEYIDKAFKAARAADPKARLYINEFGLEEDGARWDAMVNLLTQLQARGVPIDGVGFQFHVYTKEDQVDKDVLIKHMQSLASMGFSSRISEVDVLGDDHELQIDQYETAYSVCRGIESCTGVTTWGVTDRYGSNTTVAKYPLELGNNLLWDKDYSRKAAYDAVTSVFK